MPREKGKPSGIGKSEGTGMPSDFRADSSKKDKKITQKYTEDETQLANDLRVRHPNRNVNKEKPRADR